MKSLYPEVFPSREEERMKKILSDDFKEDARGIMGELYHLMLGYDCNAGYGDNSPVCIRARWVIAQLCYGYIPGTVDDELGRPFGELREDRKR